MAAHADADGRDLHHIIGALQGGEADVAAHPFQHGAGPFEIRLGHREGDVGGLRVIGDDLNDHVHIDIGFGEGHEDGRRDAGLVGNAAQGQLRLVAREGDSGDDLLFHDVLLVTNERTGLGVRRIVEGRAHEGLHLVHHRHLDGANLQHLGAKRRHFKHFLEGDPVKPARLGHDARIGRIDPVHVRIDVAAVRLDGGGDGDRAGVRAAASERRQSAGRLMDALEARDDSDFLADETGAQAFVPDGFDAGGTMGVGGADRDLPALPGAGGDADFLQCDGQKA